MPRSAKSKRFSRFSKRETKKRGPASPLKCPRCGALASQDALLENRVVVVCSAGCLEFQVTKPKFIREDPQQ